MAARKRGERMETTGASETFGMAVAVGGYVPDRLLIAATSASALSEGVAAGVLEEGPHGYRASPALAGAVDLQTDRAALMDGLFDATIDWIESARPAEISVNGPFVLQILGWGAERGQWEKVLRIARKAEGPIARARTWAAWKRVLLYALAAARAMTPHDEEAEAWALHQLGSRALVTDEPITARQQLHRALEKRELLGLSEAAQLTRHNLGLVPLAIASLLSLLFLLFGQGGLILATTMPWEALALVEIVEEVVEPAGAAGSVQVTLRNVGSQPWRVSGSSSPSGIVVDTSQCETAVGPDGECIVQVSAVSDPTGPDLVTVAFEFEPEVMGDKRVIVRLGSGDG